jgi:hypothetical protein
MCSFSSLRGAKATKQSTLAFLLWHGLLRFARNDGQVSKLLRGGPALCSDPVARNTGTARFSLIHATRRITPVVDRTDGSIANL